jgi:hypothetical protein
MNYISKDLWPFIFENLDPEEILNCSLVCKLFYELGSNNFLWFEIVNYKMRMYTKKTKDKDHPLLKFYNHINYKKYYLSLFHHPYHFGLLEPYKNLKQDYEHLVGNSKLKENLKFFGVYVPIMVFSFPLFAYGEWIDYKVSKRKEKHYCNCKICKRRQYLVLYGE